MLNNVQKIIILIFVVFFIPDLLTSIRYGYVYMGALLGVFPIRSVYPEYIGLSIYICCIIGFFLFKTKNKTAD